MLPHDLRPLFAELVTQAKTPDDPWHGWLTAMDTAACEALAEELFTVDQPAIGVVQRADSGLIVCQRKVGEEPWSLQSAIELCLEGSSHIVLRLTMSVTRDTEPLKPLSDMDYLGGIQLAGTLYPRGQLHDACRQLEVLIRERLARCEDRLPLGRTPCQSVAGELAYRLMECVLP